MVETLHIQENEELHPQSPVREELLGDGAELRSEREEILLQLEKFLEERVFSEFHLTEQDRNKALEELMQDGASAEILQITDRSYQNIRETLRLFFQEMCVDGLDDEEGIQKILDQKSEDYKDNRLKQIQENSEYQEQEFDTLAELDSALESLIKTRDELWMSLPDGQEFGEKILSDEYLDLQRRIDALQASRNKVSEKTSPQVGEELVPTTDTHKASFEYALQELLSELERTKNSSIIYHNCSLRAVERGIRGQAILGITALEGATLEQAIQRRKEDGWDKRYTEKNEDKTGYLYGRKEIEKALGYEGKAVAYGILETGQKTQSEAYGPVTIIVNQEAYPEIFFSEGDSIPGILSTGEISTKKREKYQDFLQEVIEYAKDRQLSYDHALISKAARTIVERERASLNGKDVRGGSLDYTETHLIGGISFDRAHIREIRVKDEATRIKVASMLQGTAMDGCPVVLR